MKDKCIEKIIRLYFDGMTVKQAIGELKKECKCGKCDLNCKCGGKNNV